MDTFFSILKKGIVATIFLIFSFSAVYIPNPINNVNKVNAWEATEVTQIANNILIGAGLTQQQAINVTTTIQAGYDALSSAYNSITSFATNKLHIKEFVLDGIAWKIAKSVISSMVQSLVEWINSGFKGSPMFVQDLMGTLLETADQVAGQYIQELGGIGSFICSPFRLDVQIALSVNYDKARIGQPVSTCSLSGIINNLEGFLSGAQGSFSEGGWNDWFDVTSQPEKYTPLGAKLSAEIGMDAAIINAKGEKMSILEFGQGFLSNEVCETEYGWAEPREKCYISTPGKTIADSLSFNLDSGRQSLISADEIDEIIGSLFSQLANTAITGFSGMMGMSSDTGYTYDGYAGGSYVNQMSLESLGSIDYDKMTDSMQESLATQQSFRSLAITSEPKLRTKNISAANAALEVISDTNISIPTITQLIAVMNDVNSPVEQKNQAISDFNSLKIYSSQEFEATKENWKYILSK